MESFGDTLLYPTTWTPQLQSDSDAPSDQNIELIAVLNKHLLVHGYRILLHQSSKKSGTPASA